ncbi:reverse transcriptase domain-containing protein, partial [Tanacetum coccineum]
RAKAIPDEVQRLVKAGIMREVLDALEVFGKNRLQRQGENMLQRQAADSRREYSGYRAPDQPKNQFNDRGGNRSIKDFEELRKAFRRNFTQRKKYSKNPVELARIRQRSGEYLDSFTKRFKDEMVYFKHCPDLMKISAYMNGINNQDLIKKLNDKVPQTFNELMR